MFNGIVLSYKLQIRQVDLKGALKMQDQKMQDWKMTDQRVGVENTGLENAGL